MPAPAKIVLRIPVRFGVFCVTGVVLLLRMTQNVILSPQFVASTFCCAVSLVHAAGAEESAELKRDFNLPAGNASETLYQFADASGRHILYRMEKVRGERTNAVVGSFLPEEALRRLLAGTALTASQDPATGAFIISRKAPDESTAEDSREEKGEGRALSKPDSKHMKKKSSSKLLSLLLGFIVAADNTSAQSQTNASAADDEKEDVVVLSPFVITSSSDVGYGASESLAGTGLATKLTDLGASVTVVTEKFLKDTGSTDLRDVLVYQANAEVSGYGGNFSGTGSALGGVTSEPGFTNNASTRVRGLAAATQARNFYRNLVPMDSYNIERLEINRGANSLLFGVGSPAGIINYTTKNADVRESTAEATFAYGSHESARASLDINQAIIKDQFAIRLATVYDDEKYQQEPAFNDDRRFYAAAEWRIRQLERGIFSGTTIRGNFEDGRIRSNNPRLLPPGDRLSWWFEDTISDAFKTAGAIPKIPYDATGPAEFTKARRNVTLGIINNVNRSPTFVFQDNTAVQPRDATWPSSGQPVLGRAYVSNLMYYPQTGFVGTVGHSYVRETSRIYADFGIQDAAFYTSQGLSDPSIFNFYDILIDGPNKEELTNFSSKEFSLEQVLLGGQAGFELAYNDQKFDESRQSLIPSGQPWISIDVNSTMWTGEVNPNFGRPFISSPGQGSYNQSEVETSRAKAFYRADFSKHSKGWLGALLGRHVLSSLVQRETYSTESRNGNSPYYTPDFWAAGNNQSRLASQSKQITTWHYLGDSVYNRTTPVGLNLPGIGVNRLNFQDTINGQGLVLDRGRPASVAIAAQDLPQFKPKLVPIDVFRDDNKLSNTASSASKSRRVLDSQAFAIQSNWLEDHLVSTVGWRKEESSILGVNAPADPNGEGYARVDSTAYSLDDPSLQSQVFEDTLFSWSLVAKTPEKWLKLVPVVSALNFFYGVSENFDPPASRTIDPLGEALPPPGGKTVDYGAYIELAEGKVGLKLNFFETTQTGSFNSNLSAIVNQVVSNHLSVFNSVRDGNIEDRGDGFPSNYVAPPQVLLDLYNVRINNGTISSSNPGVTDTSDFVSKGMELELLLRPTHGLSLIMNVAKQESVRSNTGAATRSLLFDTPTSSGRSIAEEWRQPWAGFLPLNAGAVERAKLGDMNDISVLAGSTLINILNRWNANALADGGPVSELRKWRANAVINYDFQSRPLRGWGVGAGIRWQDKAAIGYPVAAFGPDLTPATNPTDPTNIRIQDVRNPYYGPTETNFDGWVSYQTKLWNDRVDLKIQLNVRNINVGDKLIPIVANPDGSIGVWSIAEPRRYTLSATFGF
jgi:catecholate siderophore receptor